MSCIQEQPDRRSASKCQGKCPDQTLDQAFGLSEVLVAVSTSRLSCKRAGKTRTLMPVWDSSGESRNSRMMRARWVVSGALFLAFALGLGVEFSRARAPPTLDTTVAQSLLSLIVDLQTKIDRQGAGGQSAFFPQGPINPALKSVGRPIEILLSDPVAAQGLLNFNGRVIHENGTSEWNLSAFITGQIVTYAFAISQVGSPTLPSGGPQGQIFGVDRPAFGPRSGPPTPPVITAPLAAPVVDPRVVEFLFASTRQQIVRSPTESIAYSGERGPLTFGAASVRIPDDHKIGRIELPASWRLFGLTLSSAPNEHEHFIIKRVVPISEDTFGQVVRAKGANTALVFVHGFNTSFEDALYRNAQIIWDLQYSGLSVLFTWASRGDVISYVYDKESAYLAREAFIALLQKLKRDYGIEQINVLAHSMGNLIALDALANYAQTSNPIQIVRLMMAAPDVDRDQFNMLAPTAKAIVGGMTLYASSADRTMALSRTLAGGIPRAGDVPADGPIILPNVETIDVTAVGEDIFGLNHNVFAASRDVMEDISALLRLNQPPPRLTQIRAVPGPPSAPRYWRYVR
jgi:esterase/lipase superfamily enzyme